MIALIDYGAGNVRSVHKALKTVGADVRLIHKGDPIVDADKVVFDVSAHENLQAALLGVFDSQICGGKRYDLATLGRQKAHATYYASHGVDEATGFTFGMDLTPLIVDPAKDVASYVQEFVERFAFYERARQAYAVVATSEKALYANVILKKGVL